MRHALFALPLLVGALASGCAASSSSGKFSGEEKQVADVVEKLQSAGAKADAKTVCDEVFAKSLRDQVQASGSNCEQEIDKALKDADDFDLEVQDVTINGDQATARVKGRVGDADRVQEFQFEREGSDWRATSIG
jgi:hypothetical protein